MRRRVATCGRLTDRQSVSRDRRSTQFISDRRLNDIIANTARTTCELDERHTTDAMIGQFLVWCITYSALGGGFINAVSVVCTWYASSTSAIHHPSTAIRSALQTDGRDKDLALSDPGHWAGQCTLSVCQPVTPRWQLNNCCWRSKNRNSCYFRFSAHSHIHAVTSRCYAKSPSCI